MPSAYESFGLATAEALPPVCFVDCLGSNELIEHEVNGPLVGAAQKGRRWRPRRVEGCGRGGRCGCGAKSD